MNRIVGAEGIHSQVVQRPHVDGEAAPELLRLLVDRPVDVVAQMSLDPFPVGGQHAAHHPQLRDRVAQLRHRLVDVLNGEQRHSLEPWALAQKTFVQPSVVGNTCGDRPLSRYEPPYRQSERRIQHRPFDARLVQECQPLRRPRVAQLLVVVARPQVVEVEMVQHRKDRGRSVAFGHVAGDFVLTSPVIDVAVCIDNLHGCSLHGS